MSWAARGLTIGVAVLAVACQPPPDSVGDADQALLERTVAAHEGDSPAASPVAEAATERAVVGREIAYGEGENRNLTGHLAMPGDAAEPLPGLIVIHEWWGLNDNTRAAAERLAAEGYIALAVDLYDGRVAGNPGEAQILMGKLMGDQDAARRNLRQAYDYLSKYALSPRVGVIGWCLGGGWSLQTALLLGDKLDAAVMYYGRVTDDDGALAGLATPLLGLFAGRDQAIKVADVEAFRSALLRLGKDATIHVYPNADHAFANPSGGNYDAAAATDAWAKTVEFLRAHLGEAEG